MRCLGPGLRRLEERVVVGWSTSASGPEAKYSWVLGWGWQADQT